jgi:hypothetical protein
LLGANSGDQPYLMKVNLTLSGISVSSTTLPFAYTVGQGTGAVPAPTNPATQTLKLTNAAAGTGLPSYTIASNFNIIGIAVPAACPGGVFATLTGTNSTNPGPGALTDTYTITPASAACLNAIGTASLAGSVTVTSGVQQQTIAVPMVIANPTVTTSPVSGATGAFTYTIGQAGAIPSQAFSYSTSPAGLAVTTSVAYGPGAAGWLTAAVTAGNTITLTANPAGIAASATPYTATVTVSGPGNAASTTISASLTVSGTPIVTIGAQSGTATFTYASPNSTLPPSQQFFISVSGSQAVPLTATVSGSAPWLTGVLSTTSPTLSGILFVSVNPALLVPSATPYTGTITVSGPGATPSALTVNLTVTSPTTPTVAGIFRGGNEFMLQADANHPSGLDYKNFVTPAAGDLPVAGDWNGSGTSKIGIYRPSTGTWFLDYNGNGIFDAGDKTYQFGGVAGDVPVVGDWTGTGFAKIGLVRPFTAGGQPALWILDAAGAGVMNSQTQVFAFGGIAGEVPVVGDWTGTGTTKVGVVRPFTPGGQPALWILDANNSHAIGAGSMIFAFGGITGDVPVTGDWDASGTTKIGVVRPFTAGGTPALWIEDFNGSAPTVLGGTDNVVFPFGGLAGDKPITGKW